MVAAACGRDGALIKRYEYEEELYLSLDGSAALYVNASVPSLVALRGLDLDTSPRARLDRARIRTLFSSPVTRVTRVSSSRRDGRRFVHVRLEVDEVGRLGRAAPFAWSTYRFDRAGGQYVYKQVVGAAAGRPVTGVNWTGRELVAFRMHLPSKIVYHDAPSKRVERGNILAWEQTLAERRAGAPLTMEARMETRSILYRTLWLFALTFALVVATFAAIIWWMARKGGDPATSAAD